MLASYAWGGKAIERIAEMIPNIKAEIISPILVKGAPQSEDFAAIDKLADEIVLRHKQLGLI